MAVWVNRVQFMEIIIMQMGAVNVNSWSLLPVSSVPGKPVN
jgi:hypothetical protein